MKKGSKLLSLACLFVVSTSLLTACKPTSIEKAEKKMEDEGYAVVAYEVDKDKVDGFVGGFIATNGIISGDSITAILFESADDAKDYYKDVGGEDSKWVREGKWVFMGTDNAIKDFKG